MSAAEALDLAYPADGPAPHVEPVLGSSGPAPATGADHDLATVKRRVAFSTLAQVVARTLDSAVNVAIFLAIARHLGEARYGDYALVVLLLTLFQLVEEFGLQKLAVREIARDPAREGDIVGTVTVLRLVMSLAAALAVQVVLLALGATGEVHLAGLVVSAFFLADAFLSVVVVFHVAVEQQYEALVRVVMAVFELGLVIVLLASRASIVALVSARVVAAFAGAALAYLIARRKFALAVHFDRALVRPLLREALPIFPITAIGVLYLKLDAFMVRAMTGAKDLGAYSAAYQPVEYVFLASAVVIFVLFPLLARYHQRDTERFRAVYRFGAELLVAATLGFAIVAAFVAAPLFSVAFAGKFDDAAGPFAVLSVALVFMMLNGWYPFVMLAGGHQRVMLRMLALVTLLNVAIDIPLINWLGFVGAAWGTLVTSALLTLLAGRAAHERLGLTLDWAHLARIVPAAAALVVALSALALSGAPWILRPLVAVVVYPAALLVAKVFDASELKGLLARPDGMTGQTSAAPLVDGVLA